MYVTTMVFANGLHLHKTIPEIQLVVMRWLKSENKAILFLQIYQI